MAYYQTHNVRDNSPADKKVKVMRDPGEIGKHVVMLDSPCE